MEDGRIAGDECDLGKAENETLVKAVGEVKYRLGGLKIVFYWSIKKRKKISWTKPEQ